MNMKEKAKVWWNKPITNGDQVKSGLKSMAITAAFYGGLYLVGKVAEKKKITGNDDVIDFMDIIEEDDITG